MSPDSRRTPSSSFEGDFAPGHVLIGRYRVVAMLGEGGMGQVYLADDLVLGEPVAVKFLPERLAEREEGLERFRAEARHAREVTHPNVARVHDIGEVDGRHFLTMEYVDGEDLSSLIRRIGRLPREKAAEIAQQICSGLAEAHRRGVLHRDLKPANVMLDGEGRVRLTDFGLAIPEGAEASMAGTPQYMAPEQLSGVPASIASEVYSLGLLLYELYTGKRALRGRTLDDLRREHEEGAPEAPSSQLTDIDPQVDAVLTRCLARDPEQRPRSVQEVARSLPGGDPLAAAIAAGETPAPHVVAAAESDEGLTPRIAAALALGTLVLIAAFVIVSSAQREREGIRYGKPSAVLRDRARELVRELTGDDFDHEVHWHVFDADVDVTVAAVNATPEHADVGLPTPLLHHSRFAKDSISPSSLHVSPTDPAPAPDSVHLALDVDGKLVAWQRVAPEGGLDEGGGSVDWDSLVALTGHPAGTLEPIEPRREPPVFATDRRAWRIGPAGVADGEDLTIEAAAHRGRPVHLEVLRGSQQLGSFATPRMPGIPALIVIGLLVLTIPFAWRNLSSGRADHRGALKVGAFLVVTHIALIFGYPIPNGVESFGSLLFTYTSYSLHLGVRALLIYLALEPFARKRWPRALISWSRLLEGRLHDPSVGREVSIGLLAGAAVILAGRGIMLSSGLAGPGTTSRVAIQPVLGLDGPLQALAHFAHGSGDAVMICGLMVFMLLLFRSIVRYPLAANVLWLIGLSALMFVPSAGTAPVTLLGVLFLVTRVGFLSAITMFFTAYTLGSMPTTFSTSEGFFTSSLVVLAGFAFLAFGSYRTAVAGRPLFGEEGA